MDKKKKTSQSKKPDSKLAQFVRAGMPICRLGGLASEAAQRGKLVPWGVYHETDQKIHIPGRENVELVGLIVPLEAVAELDKVMGTILRGPMGGRLPGGVENQEINVPAGGPVVVKRQAPVPVDSIKKVANSRGKPGDNPQGVIIDPSRRTQ